MPVTSNVEQNYPSQVLLHADDTGPRADAKAQAEQIRSASVDCLGKLIAGSPPSDGTPG